MSNAAEISNTSTVKRLDDLVGCDIDEEIIIMSIENGEYYNFNIVASTIWRILETPQKVTDIVKQLTAKYEITEQDCETSVITFLRKLKKEGLVCST